MIKHGDCLKILNKLEPVDLIYVDVPFNTGKNFSVYNDSISKIEYNNLMFDVITELHNILKKTGSIYIHCDYRSSNLIRFSLDKIFGEENFRNEIVWAYEGGGRSKTKQFARKHDTIFFYTKSNEYTFNMNEILLPHTEAQLKRYNVEINGERYANMKGKLRPLGNGKIPSDVWVDIPPLSCNSKERTGYPTQKPEALLERIIKASSNPNDIVLDPMCGSGTTLMVAKKLGRKYIGIDSSYEACEISRKRLGEEI